MYQKIFSLHADFLKAMAHPRRLEIINLLRDKELPVGDIYKMLDLPQANISQHLMILRDAGLVTTRREGKQIFYRLSHPNIIKSCNLIRGILIENTKDKAFAKELKMPVKKLVPLVHDPVCKMRLSPCLAGFKHKHQNFVYYFCASGCLKEFKKNPQKYVKPE